MNSQNKSKQKPEPSGSQPLQRPSIRQRFRRLGRSAGRWTWMALAVLALAAILVALTQADLLKLLTGTAGQLPTSTPPQPTAQATPQLQVGSPGNVALGSNLMFIENVGQFSNTARFLVRGSDRSIWLAEDGVWVTALERASPKTQSPTNINELGLESFPPLAASQRGVNLKVSFSNANSHPQLVPFNRLNTRVSFLIGSNPSDWHTDVPVWGGVRYIDLYPGVDLQITGENGRWDWQLAVRDPSFDISNVRLRVEGAAALSLESLSLSRGEGESGAANNHLRLSTAVGDIVLPLLAAAGASAPVLGGQEITSPFASPLAQPAPVTQQVIDPQDDLPKLLYATFLDGSSEDRGRGIVVDGAGNAYITGETGSPDFPTQPGVFTTTHSGSMDVFVVKLNPSGSTLDYATFLGGTGEDKGYSLAVDEVGYAYITGETDSADFPITSGAYITTHNGLMDVFVVKLNPTGSALEYSTFLGGSDAEGGQSLAIDQAGHAYITGKTSSTDFPTTAGAFAAAIGGLMDVFVVKLNPSGSALDYATFLGGVGDEMGNGVAVDAAGNAYVTGATASANFPATKTFTATSSGAFAAFVVKLDPAASTLVYATFLSNTGPDSGRAIAVDSAGNAYVMGMTASFDFPTTDGTRLKGLSDAFIVKLDASGSFVNYATLLGGSGTEYGFSLVVDENNKAYVTGNTLSADFPATKKAFDKSYNGGSFNNGDVFVAQLDSIGSLSYATFLGGSGGDYGSAIAVDKSGAAFITGYSDSTDFPTTTLAFNSTPSSGAHNAFVVKLRIPLAYSVSGHVSDDAGSPVAGVTIVESVGNTAITDAHGDYVLGDLAGGTYTITLLKSGYTPVSRLVSVPPDVTSQNFTITPASEQIYLPLVQRNW